MMIEVKNVSKTFRVGSILRSREASALEDISFSIDRGEAVAFLGPNGAGKSTLIRILAGILKPTSGYSQISGHLSGTRAANKRLGLVMGTRSQMWMNMTIEQNLSVIGEIYGLSSLQKKHNLDDLIEPLGLKDLLNQRARVLSLGQRMRCELAAALLPGPEVLLLDEPTIGLDLLSKISFRQLLSNWCTNQKTTVLLTSHDIADIAAIGRRTVIIRKGRKVFDGAINELRDGITEQRSVKLTLRGYSDPLVLPFTQEQGPFAEFLKTVLGTYGDNLLDLQITETPLDEILGEYFAERSQ